MWHKEVLIRWLVKTLLFLAIGDIGLGVIIFVAWFGMWDVSGNDTARVLPWVLVPVVLLVLIGWYFVYRW